MHRQHEIGILGHVRAELEKLIEFVDSKIEADVEEEEEEEEAKSAKIKI